MSIAVQSAPLTTERVVEALDARFADALWVTTCGFTTRRVYNACDREGTFYLVGSMGMAAPVAGGISSATGRTVLAIDGDGSFAMNLGALPMIAAASGEVVHVVLDNGLHESTGGQKVQRADPVPVALAAGYRQGLMLSTPDDLGRLDEITRFPAIVHVLVAPMEGPIGRRVDLSPKEITERFVRSVRDE